jgi:hypothetical protein
MLTVKTTFRWDSEEQTDELAGGFDVLLCGDCFFFQVLMPWKVKIFEIYLLIQSL